MTRKGRIRGTGSEHRRLELGIPQIVGSALAALTAAVAASYLGVAGTVIGAAAMSFASTVITEVYAHYLKRTGDKVKQHTQSIWRDRSEQEPRGGLPWLRLGLAATLVFAVSMGAILIYQEIADRTVADQVAGKPRKKDKPDKTPDKRDKHAEPHRRAPSEEDPAAPPASPARSPAPSRSPVAERTPTPTPTTAAPVTSTPSQVPSYDDLPDMMDEPPPWMEMPPVPSPALTGMPPD
jgi:hypothetical protein